jgi:hypothetical protein
MSNQGTKFDDLKPQMDLLCPIAMEELAGVLTMGAKKYGKWNWSKGILFSRILAAILRHTFAYMSGQTLDPESGRSHMAHVMCNCMFILRFEKLRKDLDDRQPLCNNERSNAPEDGVNNKGDK